MAPWVFSQKSYGAPDVSVSTNRGLAGLGAGPDQEFDTGTTIFATMEKNLGIKLERRDQSMPVIVIDRVDRVPTEN